MITPEQMSNRKCAAELIEALPVKISELTAQQQLCVKAMNTQGLLMDLGGVLFLSDTGRAVQQKVEGENSLRDAVRRQSSAFSGLFGGLGGFNPRSWA